MITHSLSSRYGILALLVLTCTLPYITKTFLFKGRWCLTREQEKNWTTTKQQADVSLLLHYRTVLFLMTESAATERWARPITCHRVVSCRLCTSLRAAGTFDTTNTWSQIMVLLLWMSGAKPILIASTALLCVSRLTLHSSNKHRRALPQPRVRGLDSHWLQAQKCINDILDLQE